MSGIVGGLAARAPFNTERAAGSDPRAAWAEVMLMITVALIAQAILQAALVEDLDDDPVTIPALWRLLAVVVGSALVVAALTAVPARISARRPAGRMLQSELAIPASAADAVATPSVPVALMTTPISSGWSSGPLSGRDKPHGCRFKGRMSLPFACPARHRVSLARSVLMALAAASRKRQTLREEVLGASLHSLVRDGERGRVWRVTAHENIREVPAFS